MSKVNVYDGYLDVCRKAVSDDKVYANFKCEDAYRKVLEHLSYEEGLEYLKVIVEHPLLDCIGIFSSNDDIGNPYKFFYPTLGLKVSPTTIRYIKVLIDLVEIFNTLDDLDIVEIGGGYGGQCKVIHDVFTPRSYTIIDLPDALALSEKYLTGFRINARYRQPDSLTKTHYDLCISNYAFTEFNKEHQLRYSEQIIKNSDKGYITCNFVDSAIKDNRYSKADILALKKIYTLVEEKPLTAADNFIYTW